MISTISAVGNTYYLDPVNGDIGNDGSENAPWSTIQEDLNWYKTNSLVQILLKDSSQKIDVSALPKGTYFLKTKLSSQVFMVLRQMSWKNLFSFFCFDRKRINHNEDAPF